nr:hypothetical protein [Tanacetum cinerariifolium]
KVNINATMKEEPKNVVPIITVKPTEILTLEVQPITTIISTSQSEPSISQRKGKAIVAYDQPKDQRKLVLASKEIQAHLDKEEKIKNAAKEAKLFEITKTKVIKVVQEEAKKIGLDPKKIISAKAVLMVYRNNNKRNFKVHNSFKFGDFGITELDELGLIIEKKKNSIVKDLMISLGKRQVASQSSRRKRKHIELEPEIKVPRLECNKSLPDGVPFVNNMVIEEPEYGIFFTDVFGDQAFQRWNDIHKVGVDSLVSYLVMASMVKTQENARFGLKLKKLIAEHPDQEKLQSKKES